MWYETLQQAMTAEKNEYIKNHIDTDGDFFGSAPKQFNVQLGQDGENILYKVEFMENESEWIDATTWESGEDATKIFIACDANDIDLSRFESDWITKL